MITKFDYISIAFYFIFVVTVGVVFSRRNKNTSDYFRGGGIMPCCPGMPMPPCCMPPCG